MQLLLGFFLPFLLRHRYACFIEFAVKALLNFQGELCPDTLRHIVNAAIEAILPCRLAVWVCTHYAFRGNGAMRNVFPISYKKRVMLEDDRRAFFLGNGKSFYKLLFNPLADFFTSLLLQDDEVTAYVRSCIV